MTEENKTDPAVKPETEAQTPAQNGAAEKPAPVQAFEIPAPTKTMTHNDMVRRAFRLAERWNKLDAKRADLVRRRDELDREIGEAVDSFAPIRAEMRVLYGVCKANELPVTEAMREMVEDRTDEGINVAPPPMAEGGVQ